MEQPQNLRSLFAAAKAEKTDLEHRPDSNTDGYRNDVNETIAKFKECQRQVEMLSLFSTNEPLDDIATGDIQYLTVEYLLADLLQRSYNSDRESTLMSAFQNYERFLTRLYHYDILNDKDKKLYERYTANPRSFSLVLANDAAARRETKINRFREEKELKQKLEYLSNNQSTLQSDDDDVRRLYLAEIDLYIHQTFQTLDLLSQELTMLSSMRHMPKPEEQHQDDSRRRNGAGESGYSERLDPPLSQLLQGGKFGPILSREGKPMQPFTLLDRRTQLQQGVFRSGHNLPTMTIDEYLEEEHRRGNVIEGGGEQSGIPPEVDEDDMDKADEETMKAREWDEFTEANPRGSGNTLNRG
ncbi:TAP42-like protein [Aspergillus taichungensis]|uniref:TAP42-like protein n=1 Tax=Aspergillus taichungensis TaxID=482145 RepID=A0A2J5HPI8_9EURO|nr:TAP42-like protein [Aspergillus taichungensis]